MSCGSVDVFLHPQLNFGGRFFNCEFDDTQLFAKAFGSKRKQSPALGAGHAKPFIAAQDDDFAVIDAMIVILAGGHHVAEFAIIAYLLPHSPTRFQQVEPAWRALTTLVGATRNVVHHERALSRLQATDEGGWMPQTSSVQGTSRGREAAIAL